MEETPMQVYRRLTKHRNGTISCLANLVVSVLCYADDVVEGRRDYDAEELAFWVTQLAFAAKAAGAT